ncbi:MAG: Hsp70 family protein, partial [Methylococcaceae bacterium]
LINEPTAAALAYGVNNQADEQTYIIIDLGGGTFDVSILEKFDNIMEVHASAGDSFLGGEDFTERLVKEFCKEKSLDYEKLSQKDKSQLYYQFERLKQQLSKEKKVEVNFQVNEQNYSYSLDHDKFNKQVKPLLQKLLAPIENSIRDANIRIQDMDDIFIVGGATRMPIIRQFIARLFGRLPSCHINPDEVVAMGAAIQAALKERNEDFDDIVLTDVCPFSMGIETSTDKENGSVVSGLYSIILERNQVIPVSRTERFFTMRDNQHRIDVNIFQGEQRLTDNNIKLGNISINVPTKKRGEESIDIRFTYDINGLLEVVVTVTSTKEKKQLVINNSQNRMTDKEIKQALKKLDQLKIHPRDKSENQALLSRAERIFQQSLGHERDQIGRLLLQFETVLDSQDEKKIKKAVSEFMQALDTLDNNLWS